MSEFAAKLIVTAAQAAVRSRGIFHFALSGGSTPNQLFQRLAEKDQRDKILWQKTHIYWADERNVPPDHQGSNYGQVKCLFLDKLDIPTENIHRIKGELESAESVTDYSRQLKSMVSGDHLWPIFDVILLGLGADGHTASLFPGQTITDEANSPVIAVTAKYDDRPAKRITLTPPVFNTAREIIFLVAGSAKAAVVSATLEGPMDAVNYPAQRISPIDGKEWWLLDSAAASQLVDL